MRIYESIIDQMNIERIIMDKSHDALEKIRDIINDDELTDEDCFKKVDEIIFTLERIGVICKTRHGD